MRSLVEYISRDSPRGAFRVHDQITKMAGLLAEWPDLGRQWRKHSRELVVPRTPYIVIYRKTKRAVIIQRVLHGRQKR